MEKLKASAQGTAPLLRVSEDDVRLFSWARNCHDPFLSGAVPIGDDDNDDGDLSTSAVLTAEHVPTLDFKRLPREDGGGSSASATASASTSSAASGGDVQAWRERMRRKAEAEWVRQHAKDAASVAEGRLRVLALADDASRYGYRGGAFLPCPFSREQLVIGLGGRNLPLCKLVQSLDIVMPLVPLEAICKCDVTGGANVNTWLITRSSVSATHPAAPNIFDTSRNLTIRYEPRCSAPFGWLCGGFGTNQFGVEQSATSLGTCLFMAFVPTAPAAASVFSSSSSSSSSAAAAAVTAAAPAADGIQPSDRVICLDVDGTLIRAKNHAASCKTVDDFEPAFEGVLELVRRLHGEGGCKVVLFTNQNGICDKRTTTAAIVLGRLENVARAIGVPCQIFVAPTKDNYRKPYGAMWLLFQALCNGGREVDLRRSVFVGDAAGRAAVGVAGAVVRRKDFAASDLNFARMVGLPFMTPEDWIKAETVRLGRVAEMGAEAVAAEATTAAAAAAAAGAISGVNFNTHLTRVLQELLPLYRARNLKQDSRSSGASDHQRREQMTKALGVLSHLPYKVATEAQARSLINVVGIGPKTVEKIVEILRTGKLNRLEELKKDTTVRQAAVLMRCPYIGSFAAKRLIRVGGVLSLEDLNSNKARLLQQGLVDKRALMHLEVLPQLKERIPRDEGAAFMAFMRRLIDDEIKIKGCLVQLGGSFRRGSSSSSDLDMLVSAPEPYGTMDLMRPLYKLLWDLGVLVGDISDSTILKQATAPAPFLVAKDSDEEEEEEAALAAASSKAKGKGKGNGKGRGGRSGGSSGGGFGGYSGGAAAAPTHDKQKEETRL